MDLDAPVRVQSPSNAMRYVLFRLIEETALHARHGDIMREVLDCSRGI
ncbi:DUF664 domain-containing protein [Verrucosispora sp. NA02020]|nr:DUF664 domain-containing protein [Verrucosispora sp. NA02020]